MLKVRPLICWIVLGLTLASRGDAQDRDEVVCFSTTVADQKETVTYDYSVPTTRFFTVPTWDGQTGGIPLSPEKAISIAKKATTMVRVVDGSPVNPNFRPIENLSLQSRNNRWWYVIQFKNYPPQLPDPFPQVNIVVVLMDGSTVGPHKRM